MGDGQSAPGNCPKCGSTETNFTKVKPPKVKSRGDRESKTAHRCTSACEQVARFCIPCHLVTPLPVGTALPEIPGQRLPEPESMQRI